jgi:aromatic-L-amino-acid/L-tryptophan decarboxylase
MSPEEFRKWGHHIVDWLAEYQLHPERYPVLSKAKPGEVYDALPTRGPDQGESMEAVLADFENIIVPGLTHWNHPGFMAYFANTASGPGILGELLSAGLNSNGILWKTSPALTELELLTLSWLRDWMALPNDWFGMIHDTASTAILHAVAAARMAVAPEGRETGEWPKLTMYASEHVHSCADKAAIALGIGHRNLRKIPSDSLFRMRPELLQAAIEEDLRAGKRPFLVVATVGTTSTSAVDPVPAIADITEKYGLWLHIDSAYAGSAAVSPKHRYILEGCERAQSLVVNPHKWFFTPVDLSVLYTSKPELLRQTFSVVPEFLRSREDPRAVNLMEYAIPLGRRFRALKLWFIMRYYGRDKIVAMIEDHIVWAQELAGQISAHPDFEICAPTDFSLVSFRKNTSDEENKALMEQVNNHGEVFISHTALNGRLALRLAIGNMGTTRAHVQRAWEIIQHSNE